MQSTQDFAWPKPDGNPLLATMRFQRRLQYNDDRQQVAVTRLTVYFCNPMPPYSCAFNSWSGMLKRILDHPTEFSINKLISVSSQQALPYCFQLNKTITKLSINTFSFVGFAFHPLFSGQRQHNLYSHSGRIHECNIHIFHLPCTKYTFIRNSQQKFLVRLLCTIFLFFFSPHDKNVQQQTDLHCRSCGSQRAERFALAFVAYAGKQYWKQYLGDPRVPDSIGLVDQLVEGTGVVFRSLMEAAPPLLLSSETQHQF